MKNVESKAKTLDFNKFEIVSIEKLNFIGGGSTTSEDSIIETNEGGK